jgi:hypothetical protein
MGVINPKKSFVGIIFKQPKISVNTLTEFESILQEDLENCFFGGDFDIEIKYYHTKESFYTKYRAIKNTPYSEVSVGQTNGVGVETSIRINERKFKYYPRKSDHLFMNGIKYYVDSVQPNGVGILDLILSRNYRA